MSLRGFSQVLLSGILGFALTQLTPIGFLSDVQAGPPSKTIICHLPPGNPANAHTIEVSSNAVAAHLAHGDHLGACGVSDCDDEDPCTNDILTPEGQCIHTGVDCSDGIACTIDSCEAGVGCHNVPNCTTGFECSTVSGLCIGPKECDGGACSACIAICFQTTAAGSQEQYTCRRNCNINNGCNIECLP